MKLQWLKGATCGALIVALLLEAGTTAFAKTTNENIQVSYQAISIFIDGDWLKTDKAPFTYNGTVFLPVREVAEAVGMDVSWNQSLKAVSLTSKKGKKRSDKLGYGFGNAESAKVANENIKVSYQNISIYIDGQYLNTDKEPFTYNGTTFLPVRAVAEAVGMDVNWNQSLKTVFLTSKDEKITTTAATNSSKEGYNDTKDYEREALLKELEEMEEEIEEREREREERQREREERERQKELAAQDKANSQKTTRVLTEDGWVWMSEAEANKKKSSEKKVKILREGEGWVYVTEEEARQYRSNSNNSSNTNTSSSATTGIYVIGSGYQSAEDFNKSNNTTSTEKRKVLREGVGWVYE